VGLDAIEVGISERPPQALDLSGNRLAEQERGSKS
jgi:hypothetical protein